MRRISIWLAIIAVFALSMMTATSQDAEVLDCSEAGLQAFILEGTADILEANPDAATSFDLAYIYRVGELTTDFALLCDYQPTFAEVESQIERTLDLAPLSFVIAASSIGSDVEAALIELETVQGDSQTGQLLYNGLELALDGTELGCSGCHTGGVAGPNTEGTYTRIEEIRLVQPELNDYTIEEYMVESILHPANYIVEEYANVQMPTNYGTRLDAQMLADLVAYLESQDQLLD